MSNQISKYIALGIPEDDVFAMTTINPARHMKIDDRAGSLTIGHPADIAVFKKEEFMTQFGDRTSNDSSVQLRFGDYVYRCVMTVKNGEVVYRDVMF